MLNQTVKRNLKRFPADFMFQLTADEANNLKSHFVISSWGGMRKLPFAFTEQGIAMLSGLLNSDTAIEANIQIMRAFVKIRHSLQALTDANAQITELREFVLLYKDKNDGRIARIMRILDSLTETPPQAKRVIGFGLDSEKK
ncbi:MAG: hypothetical protein Ta2A_15630 [Treponemataceae bacterium]|nr:MAG: hypothetical protein Ta2A_15630 [Treponemataceae bacterium]